MNYVQKPVSTCAQCMTADRYKSGQCKVCSRAWNAKSAKLHADKVKERKRIWNAANAQRVSEVGAAYYLANKERQTETSRAWVKANPEKVRIKQQNRRAKVTGTKLSNGLVEKLFKLQKGLCPCCAAPLGEGFHLDHRMPLALGGTNTDDNMQLLRKRCNQQKNAKHPVDFMQSRGFLL